MRILLWHIVCLMRSQPEQWWLRETGLYCSGYVGQSFRPVNRAVTPRLPKTARQHNKAVIMSGELCLEYNNLCLVKYAPANVDHHARLIVVSSSKECVGLRSFFDCNKFSILSHLQALCIVIVKNHIDFFRRITRYKNL